jgi:CRP-like cAMP-binding protein
MIPIELLARFSFFSFMDEKELKAMAMISQEVQLQAGDILVEAGAPADALYFLMEGSVPYSMSVTNEYPPDYSQDYIVGSINPEEILGISALIEPYFYTTTLRGGQACRLIEINAHALRALCEVDLQLSAELMKAVAQATLKRLNMTRVQFVAHMVETAGKQEA